MPHVIFLAPHFPANQRRFVQGLKRVGAMVTGIGDVPYEYLDDGLRRLLDGYEYLRNMADEDALEATVRAIQKRGPWVHHFECTVEAHMIPTARVRERCAIPGTPYEVVERCRDKFVMKQFLAARGIPCAKTCAVESVEDARKFAKEVGYPLILKPRAGAGAHGTHKLDNDDDLVRAANEEGLGRRKGMSMALEEFVSGHEGFFDTLTVQGQVAFETVCHYYPNVLPAMRDRDVRPQIVMTNRIEADGYQQLRQFGRKVIAELGIVTSASHMEWFYGPKGLSFAEIGARPPGCNVWDLYAHCGEFDLYTEWARAICWGDVHATAARRYAGGIVAIRPNRDGTVQGYRGVEEVQSRYGEYIFRMHLPPPGSGTQPVEAGYLANAYVYIRHPDYDGCRAVLDDIGKTLEMYAG